MASSDGLHVKIDRAIAICRQRTDNTELTRLANLLSEARIPIEIMESADAAGAALAVGDHVGTRCVLVDGDLAARGGGDPRMARGLAKDLEQLRAVVPHIAPIVFAKGAPPALIIESFRHGAFDFLELSTASDADVLQVFERAATETQARLDRRQRVSELRGIVEDFLRVLVKTERRSIDLEDRLKETVANADSGIIEIDPERPPYVLVVDDDEEVLELLADVLQADGLMTQSAGNTADAIAAVVASADSDEPFDLLLIDKNLPDGDGVSAIASIRERGVDIAAMIMTGFASTESAIDAADLGVVGYVLKPFDDVKLLTRRVHEVASRAMVDRRERRYLDRIKERHAEFLLRYRALASQLDKLV